MSKVRVLEIRNLSFKAEGRTILDGVSLEIRSGLTIVTGESGAGKSTFLSLIGGLQGASGGEVILRDADGKVCGILRSGDADPRETAAFRRDHTAVILQDNNLLGGLSVLENVETAAAVKQCVLTPDAVRKVFAENGLAGMEERKPDTMSGGEKQRASLLRALIPAPDILLADEPTGSLDSSSAEEIFRKLKKMSEDRIVIVVTHNLGLAQRYGDRLITICDGRVVSDVPNIPEMPAEIRKSPVPMSVALPYRCHASGRAAGRQLKEAARRLSRSHIRRFRSKFRFLAGLLSLSFAAAGTIHAVMHEETVRMADMNGAYYNADEIDVYPEDPSEFSPGVIVTGGEGGVFSEEEIDAVRALSEFREVIPVNRRELYLKGTYKAVACKGIALDGFFRSRIMKEGIEGRFPETEYEMILGEDAARAVGEGVKNGDVVILEDDAGHELALTVAGINHRRDVDGEFLTYIPFQSLLGLGGSGEAAVFLASSLQNPQMEVYSEDADGIIAPAGENIMLAGKRPAKEGEAALSESMADILFRILSERKDLQDDDSAAGRDPAEPGPLDPEILLSYLSEEDLYLRCSGARTARVTGIHSGETELIEVSSDWYRELTAGRANVLECYAKDMKTAASFDGSRLPAGTSFISSYEERFGEAVESGRRWQTAVGCTLVFTCIMAIVIMQSFLRITLSERRYETGLLASLGADRRTLCRILMEDGKIFAAVSSESGILLYLTARFVMRITLHINGPGLFLTILVLALMPALGFSAASAGRKGIRRMADENPLCLLQSRR